MVAGMKRGRSDGVPGRSGENKQPEVADSVRVWSFLCRSGPGCKLEPDPRGLALGQPHAPARNTAVRIQKQHTTPPGVPTGLITTVIPLGLAHKNARRCHRESPVVCACASAAGRAVRTRAAVIRPARRLRPRLTPPAILSTAQAGARERRAPVHPAAAPGTRAPHPDPPPCAQRTPRAPLPPALPALPPPPPAPQSAPPPPWWCWPRRPRGGLHRRLVPPQRHHGGECHSWPHPRAPSRRGPPDGRRHQPHVAQRRGRQHERGVERRLRPEPPPLLRGVLRDSRRHLPRQPCGAQCGVAGVPRTARRARGPTDLATSAACFCSMTATICATTSSP